MMKIVVGPLEDVEALIGEHDPARVISLLAPGQPGPCVTDRPHLRLDLHDVTAEAPGVAAASETVIRALIAFSLAAPRPDCILLHCWFAVSRSPAAAFVLACAADVDALEQDVARRLRTASPGCTPNRRIVALGDACLQREGRMLQAIDEIGRGADYHQAGSSPCSSTPEAIRSTVVAGLGALDRRDGDQRESRSPSRRLSLVSVGSPISPRSPRRDLGR